MSGREKKEKTYEQRTNTFIRFLALLFFTLGATTAYFTATTPLQAPLPTFFYAIALILGAAGFFALIARIE